MWLILRFVYSISVIHGNSSIFVAVPPIIRSLKSIPHVPVAGSSWSLANRLEPARIGSWLLVLGSGFLGEVVVGAVVVEVVVEIVDEVVAVGTDGFLVVGIPMIGFSGIEILSGAVFDASVQHTCAHLNKLLILKKIFKDQSCLCLINTLKINL